MKYAIIVPTYNNSDITIDCFKSIQENSKNYTIYWVDDCSDKSEFEKVKNFINNTNIKCKTIQKKENSGFIKSVNKGIKTAIKDGCDYIIIQNNDTIINSDNWLDSMSKILEKNSNIGVVGPLSSGGSQSPWFLSLCHKEFPKDIYIFFKENSHKNTSKFLLEKHKNYYIKTLNRLAFFCVMFRSEIFHEIGLLDEIYGFGYFDDDDLCERIYRNGYFGAIACDVLVTHKAEQTFSKKFGKIWQEKKQTIYKKNKGIFDKKFGYGKYENLFHIGNKEEMLVRLWRKELEKCKLKHEILQMKNSSFWKFRNIYLNLKNRRFKKNVKNK